MEDNKPDQLLGGQRPGYPQVVRLPDTKTHIFNTALRLFATSGVENVSMRDIADAVGIKAASIYNHYINKDQIVEACYDFFLGNYDINRLNKDQYIPVLQNGTKEEVVMVTNNQFPKEIEENMVFAMLVLFSRIYTDLKAIDRYTRQIDDSMRFLNEFFETGIELGRFEQFNVRGASMLFLSARLFVAQSVTIHPESLPDLRIAQQEIISELTNILPFKY
ncbi:MAG: TetR/AcrR family transcriptional regulator [Treponema sp.]|nr:TetR/AcrR family transcriptional regulator [Treponema sp.]